MRRALFWMSDGKGVHSSSRASDRINMIQQSRSISDMWLPTFRYIYVWSIEPLYMTSMSKIRWGIPRCIGMYVVEARRKILRCTCTGLALWQRHGRSTWHSPGALVPLVSTHLPSASLLQWLVTRSTYARPTHPLTYTRARQLHHQ